MRFPEVSKAGPAAAKVFKIINRKPLIDASSTEGSQLPVVKGTIKFDDIRFAYPSRPDVIVFKHFTLEIPAGKKVAMVSCRQLFGMLSKAPRLLVSLTIQRTAVVTSYLGSLMEP